MTVIWFRVPAMCCRRCVRTISARVTDVPGVRTVEVDLATKAVRVTGTFDAAAVAAAIAGDGYAIDQGSNTTPAAAASTANDTMEAPASVTHHHIGHDHPTGGPEPSAHLLDDP